MYTARTGMKGCVGYIEWLWAILQIIAIQGDQVVGLYKASGRWESENNPFFQNQQQETCEWTGIRDKLNSHECSHESEVVLIQEDRNASSASNKENSVKINYWNCSWCHYQMANCTQFQQFTDPVERSLHNIPHCMTHFQIGTSPYFVHIIMLTSNVWYSLHSHTYHLFKCVI
jgi:hypothetical protein